MRQITIFLSISAFMVAMAEPAMAGRKGVPGRRVGGGTRVTAPLIQELSSVQSELSPAAFASGKNLSTTFGL